MPVRLTHEEAVQIARLEELRSHRKALRDFGYDPDFIGVTEVDPVLCDAPLCREPLPWARVRGWQLPARCTRCGQGIPYPTLRKWQD